LEREEPLCVGGAREFSGFSRISLWAKPAINNEFQVAQEVIRDP
jgi:hypothetical protein